MRGTGRRRASAARLLQFVQAADEVLDVAARKRALAFFGFDESIAPFGAQGIDAGLRVGDDVGNGNAHQIADGADFETKADCFAHEIGHRRVLDFGALAQRFSGAGIKAEGLTNEHGIRCDGPRVTIA